MTKKEFKESILRCRGIDWAEKGMKVQIGNGEKYSGTIVGMNSSGNLNVKTDKGVQNWHPTWNIVYFDNKNKIVKDFRNNAN